MSEDKKVFVGGLSWDTKKEGLTEAFGKYGIVVEANVVTDRESGRSRGFGFVTFESTEVRDAAISGMDGGTLDERVINVSVAIDKRKQQGSGYNNDTRY